MARIKPLALLKESISKSGTIMPKVVQGGKPSVQTVARKLRSGLKTVGKKVQEHWVTTILLLVVVLAGIYLITRETVPEANPGNGQEIAIEAVPDANFPAPLLLQPDLAGSTTVPATNQAEPAPTGMTSMQNLQLPVTGEIIRRFGFAFSPTFNDYRYHRGMDFRGASGDNVAATANGTVELAIPGLQIVLNHGNGWATAYEGIGDVKVVEGQQVKKGDILATVGMTPLAEAALGEHLHLEITYDNQAVNPEELFNPTKQQITP